VDGIDAEIKYFILKENLGSYTRPTTEFGVVGQLVLDKVEWKKGQLVLEVVELEKAGWYYCFGWFRYFPSNFLEQKKIDWLFQKILSSIKIDSKQIYNVPQNSLSEKIRIRYPIR